MMERLKEEYAPEPDVTNNRIVNWLLEYQESNGFSKLVVVSATQPALPLDLLGDGKIVWLTDIPDGGEDITEDCKMYINNSYLSEIMALDSCNADVMVDS